MDTNYCVKGYLFIKENDLPERRYFVDACVYAVDGNHAIEVVAKLYADAYCASVRIDRKLVRALSL